MCAQHIDLIICPNCNYNKTCKLFLTPLSPFLCSPILLFICFLKSSLCLHLNHLWSWLLQSSLIGTQLQSSLDTAALVLLSKGRTPLLKFFPFNIESYILHEASIALPGQVPGILSCFVSHLYLLMLWTLVTVACSWFFILVILPSKDLCICYSTWKIPPHI